METAGRDRSPAGCAGLGRAMAFGLARAGHQVVAVGHIDSDIAEIEAETAADLQTRDVLPLVADLRRPAECDRVVAEALRAVRRGAHPRQQCRPDLHDYRPGAFPPAEPQKFWQVPDEIVDAVIETNYIAADQLARRVAPPMVERGWGRIVNVTTKLDTMNRPGTHPTAPRRRRSKWRPRSGPRRSRAPA